MSKPSLTALADQRLIGGPRRFQPALSLSEVGDPNSTPIIRRAFRRFREQTPIDCTMINTWQDERVVRLVRESGRGSAKWQRNWTRMSSVPAFAKVLVEHAGGSGVAFGCGSSSFSTPQSQWRLDSPSRY